MEIGKRKDSPKIIRGVGGKAFPKDINWICNVCGNECRGFEETCQVCEHNAWTAESPPLIVN
ncbi:hypothetical protein LCGC14_1393880 [marine sediment metagenome]|uniref:RanBP2-type domain-containing protein n=1 Tax=marine sediment metagenome TaxID=412755 RepID=A0A0F9KJZ2_9ZZZZ